MAAIYALGRRRRWASAVAAGTLIGGAHLFSSFAVVAAFELLNRWIDLTATGWFGRLAGLALIVMGALQWRRGGHSHGPVVHDHAHEHALLRTAEARAREKGLWGIAVFAFLLGFAHEEEVAIVALCAGRASCWGVMGTYAIAVAGVILVLTLLSLAAFDRFRGRLGGWPDRLARVSAVVLVMMGVLYALDVL